MPAAELLELSADSHDLEVFQRFFHDIGERVIALRVRRLQKESALQNKRQGVVYDAFGNLPVMKLNSDPEACDLRVGLEEFHLFIVGAAFEGLYEEQRLGQREVYGLCSAVYQAQLNARGQMIIDDQGLLKDIFGVVKKTFYKRTIL